MDCFQSSWIACEDLKLQKLPNVIKRGSEYYLDISCFYGKLWKCMWMLGQCRKRYVQWFFILLTDHDNVQKNTFWLLWRDTSPRETYPKSKLPKLFTNWPCERLRYKIHHGGRNTGWNHRMLIIYIFRNNKTFQNYTNFASILQFIITKIERHACIINLKLKIKSLAWAQTAFLYPTLSSRHYKLNVEKINRHDVDLEISLSWHFFADRDSRYHSNRVNITTIQII